MYTLTYNMSENSNIYLQLAQGINPAGINVGVLSADTLAILGMGIPNGLISYDAAVAMTDDFDNATGAPGPDDISDAYASNTGVWYTDGSQGTVLAGQTYQTEYTRDAFTSYKEEEITQLELGFKGNAFNGRLTYAGAIYWIDWGGSNPEWGHRSGQPLCQ